MQMCTLKFWIIFSIPSIENRFGDNEVIFQDDNAYFHRAKKIKAFFTGKAHKINNMISSPDLNPIENLWWKF